MTFELTEKPRTVEAAQEAVRWLYDHFIYVSDVGEDWNAKIDDDGMVRGDCDAWTNVLSATLFSQCGFNLDEIALCIVDTDTTDDKVYNHIALGIWIDGKFLFSHNWTPKLLSKSDFRYGGYLLESGALSWPMKFVQYRLLSTGSDDWLKGVPRRG